MLLGDSVDHLLDDDGLAHAGPPEEADLAALHVGLEEVDDLDPRLEHQGRGSSWSNAGALRWISQ